MTLAFADVEVGYEIPAQEFVITRADLVRYCGASGDFNVIKFGRASFGRHHAHTR